MTRAFLWVVGLLAAAGVAAAMQTRPAAAPAALSAAAQSQVPADVNELFAKIYPVFSHPRCLNCHGVVQSFPDNIRSVTGDTHPGEEQGDSQTAAECGVCHDEPDVEHHWQFTAPESMWWVGKDVDQLCALQSAQVTNFNTAARGSSASTPGSYMHHLTNDPLITQAFRGRAGGAFSQNPLKPSDPPPLNRTEFLAAAKAWVDAGAPCKATGSISQVERLSAYYTYPYPVGEGGTTTVTEAAKRDVQVVRLPDGKAVADSKISGHQTITIKYRDKGPNGPCSVTITSKSRWISTTPQTVPADLKIALEDGKYAISFTLQPDKTRQTSEGRTVSDCGIPPLSSGPDVDDELTWEPWAFTIRCPGTFTQDASNTITCDPRQHQREPKVSGSMMRTIVGAGMDATEPQSWLNVSPAGTSRADDGTPLAITVKTLWNLTTK